jgi:hypothetical protein
MNLSTSTLGSESDLVSCFDSSDGSKLFIHENHSYNKFFDSKYNILKIKPLPVERQKTYYLGVFRDVQYSHFLDEYDFVETVQAVSGSRIEDYFPMTVKSLNMREGWRCLSTDEALKADYIDFSWTNLSKILQKSNIHYRFLIDGKENFLTNKNAFYTEFSDETNRFCPVSISISLKSIDNSDLKCKIKEKLRHHDLILKPDKGSVSTGIKIISKDEINGPKKTHKLIKTIQNHIEKFEYEGWTLSELIKPKLFDGYINSLRLYLLITKTTTLHKDSEEKDTTRVKAYLYDHYMIYRAEERYNGDPTNKLTFLTNYTDKNDPEEDNKFVQKRYISHVKWINSLPEGFATKVKQEIDYALTSIMDKVCDKLLAFNDQNMSKRKNIRNFQSFHIYGLDVLVKDDGSIKVLELNGAPAMNVKTKYFNLVDRLDYFDLFEDLMKKTVDTSGENDENEESEKDIIEEDKREKKWIPIKKEPKNVFDLFFDEKITKKNGPNFYIPYSITQKYPFILSALEKRTYLSRTRCLYDKIDLFYGLRDRYVVPETSLNYHDELINYLTSKRMRDASIINRIQGVTYYLASKDRMYNEFVKYHGIENSHKYVPETFTIYYTNYYEVLKDLETKFTNNHMMEINTFIVKPVHGSRGLGIKIFRREKKPFQDFLHEIVTHIQLGSNIGFAAQRDNKQKVSFNGITNTCNNGVFGYTTYRYWCVSRYLDDPHLITPPNLYPSIHSYKHKYNIRFYVLLVMDRLPTFSDVQTTNEKDNDKCNDKDVLTAYIFRDFVTYFSVLPYKKTKHEHRFKNLSPQMIDNMRNITNLEMINNIYQENYKPNINRDEYKKNLTSLYSKLVKPYDFYEVWTQAVEITSKTIDSVKYNLRPLNRYAKNDYRSAFNLLAYDTFLDNSHKLWLIEVNRGPDLMGLLEQYGNDICTDIFDEIFGLGVDPYLLDKQLHKKNKLKYFKKIDIEYKRVNN